jgi:uncharacterized protein (TIGR03067 family)
MMKTLRCLVLIACAASLLGCEAPTKPPTTVLGEPIRAGVKRPVVDAELNGLWGVRSADTAGKPMAMPPGLELRIVEDRYATGISGSYNDRGRIELFGDELAGQLRRMDVVGEVGMNKGKRFSAIYRMVGRDLEIIYDLSGNGRPTDFISREGTQHMRVTYQRKPQ